MKKTYILGLLSLITLLMAGLVYGANTGTIDQAATTAGTGSTYLKGSDVNISVTWTGDLANNGTLNGTACSIASSSGTITGALKYNVTNDGTYGNITYCNTTVDTTALSDDTSYTFTMTLWNITGEQLATASQTFITDNTVSVFGTITPTDASTQTTGSSVSFSVPCYNTSSATISVSSRTALPMTESSDVCTYTETLPEGVSSYSITLTDGLNITSGAYTIKLANAGATILDAQGNDILTQPQTPKRSFRGFLDWLFGLFGLRR